MKHIEIINGPNLNLTGRREPDIYGHVTMEEMVADLRSRFPEAEIGYYQSNVEGELINRIQNIRKVAIHDAIAAITTPVIEVHISNIFAREEYRRHSLLSDVCLGVVCGLGLEGYRFAVESFLKDKHQ